MGRREILEAQGASSEHFEGEEFQGTFIGRGYVSSDPHSGTFIDDVSGWDEVWQREKEAIQRGQGSPEIQLSPDRRVDMASFFPEDWQGLEVEFEITVKAKRISPYINPAEGE